MQRHIISEVYLRSRELNERSQTGGRAGGVMTTNNAGNRHETTHDGRYPHGAAAASDGASTTVDQRPADDDDVRRQQTTHSSIDLITSDYVRTRYDYIAILRLLTCRYGAAQRALVSSA